MIDFKPFARLRSQLRRGLAAAAAALGLAVPLLAGCGGSDQVEAFVPHHLHVFGDELTLLDATGRRYGMNGFNSSTSAFECALLPLWPQTVAAALGLVFQECPGTATTFTAFHHGAYGATIAAFEAQLDAVEASLVAGDVVAIQVGTNDVVELYDSVVAGTRSQAQAETEAQVRGARVATRVDGLVARGIKVVLVTLPYMGSSPWAVKKGTDAAAAIGRISDRLGGGTSLPVGRLDARDVIMAIGSDTVDGYVTGSANGSGINVTAAACTQADQELLNCLSNSLATGATTTSHLWADAKRPGPLFHTSIASKLLALLGFF